MIDARILPVEMMPSVGQEMTLLVLDDYGDAASMHYKIIYLCPTHMKDLRIGWVALFARRVQRMAGFRCKKILMAQRGGGGGDDDGNRSSSSSSSSAFGSGRTPSLDSNTTIQSVMQFKDKTLMRAAMGQRVGREPVVKDLFKTTPKLTDVHRAIKKGARTRMNRNIRFSKGTAGVRTAPVLTRPEKT